MGKRKKKSYKPKSKDTNQEKLYLLHMDLCGPIRVKSVNGKKYILVIVDDYSRFTWVKCLRSKDKALDFIIKFLKTIQVGISHETFFARSPQQNGVVERRNRTLIEAARTMLIYARARLFLWAEAVATACFTQNRSIICLRHDKIPYELLYDKLPDLSYFHVFGALCYSTNDSENLENLQPKADIGIFIGYAPTKKSFWIYNRRTRRIIKTIHADFDELTAMAFEQSSPGPALHKMTPTTITPEVIAPIAEVVAPELAALTSSPSSTIVDQDAPSPCNPQSTPETQPPFIHDDVKEENHDIEFAHMSNDLYFAIPISEATSDQSSSSDVIHTIMHLDHQISKHNSKWTKDHPLENIIGELAPPVSTRLQLHEQALFLQISQSPRGIFINQSKYALESLKKYGFESYDLVDTPMVEKSKLDEDKKGKAIDMSHYRGMIGTLLYLTDSSIALTAFLDEDHAGCQDTRRSTSGSLYCAQILWMRSQLTDYGLGFNKIPMYCDNKSVIALCCNNVEHFRSKHTDIRYHFIKEHVENGAIELYFVNTKYQLADIFTKALGREIIEFLINKLGMQSFTPKTLQQLTDEADE
nr:integrase, catalytic region, zinc finger, CCHC-type, peptidase aspartic, catalytic [Tanacetum cinerariifolium]